MSGFTGRTWIKALPEAPSVPGWESGLAGYSAAGAEWFRLPATRALFACLNREGFEVRAVGGAVRNTLLSRPVGEIDFATTATPGDMVRLAGIAGIKTVPTGIDHGTITFVIEGMPFEVTSLRTDVLTHGRHATVAFGTDWAADAQRRDFTMNALYADAGGRIYDPLGGLDDLIAGRVRFVGDAERRIKEDTLRILRFFRFSAEYGVGPFDKAGIDASIRQRDGLRSLSRERVRQEFLRILVSRRAADAISVLDETGLLLLIAGGVTRRVRFERLCAIERALGKTPDALYRLGALTLFVREDAARLAVSLRLSREEAADLEGLSEGAIPANLAGDWVALKRARYRFGPRRYLGRVLLGWADAGAPLREEVWLKAARLADEWIPPTFPVSGGDLIERGWKPGPALGARLKDLEEQWIASDFTLKKDALVGLAAKP
jgi:tRNA nucleotidyltransferase/poly(A) polymerase